MKNKIAIASAFLAASSFSFAEIALTENISVGGFVDMSYSHADDDNGESNNSYTLDQVEVSWYFDFSPVTAQIDLEYEGDNLLVDQGFVSYDLGNGATVVAGRYDSMLGFEAFEPTGLYQYSTAYDSNAETADVLGLGVAADFITPETNEGVKLTYESGPNFFGLSLQDGGFFGDDSLGGDRSANADVQALLEGVLGGPFGGTLEGSGYAVEAAFATDLGNGFNLFFGGLVETNDFGIQGVPGTLSVDSTVLNSYVTYETGAWLFAAEYIMTEHDIQDTGDIEIDSFLLMANYSYSDQASITGRISDVDVDNLGDATKLTLAHQYAFTDNLALCVELSTVDYDYDGGLSDDTLEGGIELLFTF
jgi:hypothetical protein